MREGIVVGLVRLSFRLKVRLMGRGPVMGNARAGRRAGDGLGKGFWDRTERREYMDTSCNWLVSMIT